MDENQLIVFLEELTPADFTRILTRIPNAANHISQAATHLERVSALLLYVRSSTGPGQKRFTEIVQELFPDSFPGAKGVPATIAVSGASRSPIYSPAAELRRAMTERLSRSDIGVLWFDMFGTSMDEDLPGRSKQDCVIELLARTSQRNSQEALLEKLARSYPYVIQELPAGPR